MKTELTLITPEFAAELLSRRAKMNRRLRKTIVDDFVTLMKLGEFKTSHQGVATDTNGDLIDGQHRMAAVVEFGKPVAMLLTTGVDPNLFSIIDRGTNRTISEITGESKNTTTVCMFLRTELYGGNKKVTEYSLRPFISAFRDASNELTIHCPTSVKKRSSAPIRSAAVLCMLDRDKRVAKDAYRRCILQDYKEMRPVELAFAKWLVDRNLDVSTRTGAFHRALIAFDSKAHGTSVLVREPSQHKNNAQVRISEILKNYEVLEKIRLIK